jgi:hypothetical protein
MHEPADCIFGGSERTIVFFEGGKFLRNSWFFALGGCDDDEKQSQLRARLIDQLRSSDDGSNFLQQSKTNNTRPSLTERLLSSLFLDYLAAYDYSFTTSVFLPESHLVSWAPFSYKEMLQLLHLDPSSEMHHKLKKARILY